MILNRAGIAALTSCISRPLPLAFSIQGFSLVDRAGSMTGQLARMVLGVLPRLWPGLVVAALCCCANSTQASCGDYVHHERTRQARQTGEKHNHTRLPCRGPGCDRGREQSPLTPPTFSVVRVQEKALPSRMALVDESCNYLGTAPCGHVHAIHRCFPPKRPPRA